VRRLTGTRGRLVFAAVGFFALALLVADGAVLASVAVTQSQASDAVLVSQAQVIASGLQDTNGQVTFDGSDLPGETQSGIAVDAAVVSSNTVLTQTTNQPLDKTTLLNLAAQAVRGGSPVWADIVDSHHVPRRVYAVTLTSSTNSIQTLVVSRSVAEMADAQQRTFLILVAVSAALLVIGGALTYWLAGRALQPVRTIAGMARSISEHDLHRRVDVKVPPDELGELVDTFNSMLARLEAGFNSMSTFTANASHELRAPLALMRSEVEGALSRSRSQEEYRRVLWSLRQEVEHLSRLSDQLLILARADAGALVPAKEPIDVADFLHETAARWHDVAQKRGSRLEVTAPSHGRMEADPALLRRVVDNLIDNAVRHTSDGTPVTLRGYPADGGWNVEVADHGPGVAAEHRDRLFTRFGRADSARSPEDGGAGLGLALSAAIARAHGGTLELVETDGQGAVFQLHMPNGQAGASTPKTAPTL
jgi:two-component system, OmpR family, heavy metal sensor histidine kinase CusS